MSFGSKKGTQICFFHFSQKVQVNESPPGSQMGPLRREIPIYRAFLRISQIHIKIPLNKKIFPSLKSPNKRASFHVTQKRSRRLVPEPCLTYPSGSPVMEPSLQVPLMGTPRRDMPRSYGPPSFIFL